MMDQNVTEPENTGNTEIRKQENMIIFEIGFRLSVAMFASSKI
jgi:hypothetical protein